MRTRAHWLTSCLVAAATLTFAPAAGASQILPPGFSAADQYRESVPGVSGNRVKGSDERTPEEALGEETVEALRELGPEGESVIETIREGAPESEASAPQRSGVKKLASQGDKGSGVGKVASAATGLADVEGGIGPLLPFLIITAVIGFAGLAISRRR